MRVASRDHKRTEPREVEWLLIEWPEDEPEPTKYWLSTEPEGIELTALVAKAKLRRRVERDYQELPDEIGLAPYEGPGWRGYHHHASLCIATYAFVMAERARHSPPSPAVLLGLTPPTLPVVPRGRPAAPKGGQA